MIVVVEMSIKSTLEIDLCSTDFDVEFVEESMTMEVHYEVKELCLFLPNRGAFHHTLLPGWPYAHTTWVN
jgi:hypothetical protein